MNLSFSCMMLLSDDNYSYRLQADLEVVTISGYEDVPENSEESLLKALAHQPVSVAIEASGRDFQFYSGVSSSPRSICSSSSWKRS